ncbi:MAG TPA: hypothetical protein VHD56_09055 [Tepidisphaeraceae bacterium]|nr:hypothetical protein [Tepidisphaeraceae bacterium]
MFAQPINLLSSLPAAGSPLPAILSFIWPLRLEYLNWWQATLLFFGIALPIVWLAVRSLAGLGPVRRWVALGARLLVLLLLVLIIAGTRWQRENKIAEVMVLRDISESVNNVRGHPDKSLQAALNAYLRAASDAAHKPADDRIGQISFHSQALIDALPNTTLNLDEQAIRENGHGTDISAAIQLGLASMSKDSMHRMLLISDGNMTDGDLDAATAAAAAQHVPIDVMPLNYDLKDEVLVERFVAPTWKRENEPFTIEVILRATNPPVTGKLTVLHNNQAMDMDPNTPGIQPARTVTLKGPRNVERVTVPPLEGGNVIHQFHAVFEADNVTAEIAGNAHGSAVGNAQGGDTLTQNNVSDAFTFVRGKGRVLYVDNVPDGRGQILRQALQEEQINLETISVEQFPHSLIELQNYDAIVLANVPRGAGGLGEEEQKMVASYVHDMGGGLVMIGGESSYGAGGWQGSKLEEVLPVNMDIPSQRQMPKGALVLVMHSCEMPDGNYWGEQCALKAIETLSARDEIGVISYDWGRGNGPRGAGGSQWDYLLQEKADGSKVVAAVKNMKLGDMPSFDDSMDVALNGINGQGGLIRSDAKQKHVIVISDGDPQKPNAQLMNAYLTAKVSVSTVSVYPHDRSSQGLPPTMRDIAQALKGRAYGPIDSNPNQLPQIFIKEATVVRRSLIFEDGKGIPVKLNQGSTSELIKGLTALPDVFGFVLTTKKENPQVEMPLIAGKNNDPLLAHWQAGLGKAAAWTSDAYNKWAANWLASGGYQKFWSQVVRSVSRPPMSADFDVKTVQNGDKGRIVVEALNRDAAFLNFLSVGGTVVGPDMKPIPVHFVQTGPGTYQSDEFAADQPGSYVGVLNYRGPQGSNGVMLSGMAVNSSPELRDLKSNDAQLLDIARRTGGRVLKPFDVESADLFNREGLTRTASPLPIWDLLLPILLATIIFDVAVRRIAWDWNATKKTVLAGANFVRSFTTTRKIESKPTLDALKRVREQTQEGAVKPPMPSAESSSIDRTRKFEAKGVEGDISQVVGGASDKPIPPPPKKIEPKGMPSAGPGAHMGGLLEAKRRAQQKMKDDQKDAEQS